MVHTGDATNVCSGKAVSVEQVLDIMAKIAGYRIDARLIPEFVRSHGLGSLRGSRAHPNATVGKMPWISLQETLHRTCQSRDLV